MEKVRLFRQFKLFSARTFLLLPQRVVVVLVVPVLPWPFLDLAFLLLDLALTCPWPCLKPPLTLCWPCLDLSLTLSRSWFYLALMLPWSCLDLPLTLLWPCPDFALTMSQACLDFALMIFPWPFLDLALTLSWSCLDFALTLSWPETCKIQKTCTFMSIFTPFVFNVGTSIGLAVDPFRQSTGKQVSGLLLSPFFPKKCRHKKILIKKSCPNFPPAN